MESRHTHVCNTIPRYARRWEPESTRKGQTGKEQDLDHLRKALSRTNRTEVLLFSSFSHPVSTDHSPDGTSVRNINVRFQNSQQKAYIVTLSTRTPVYLAITEKECCHCCIQQLFRNQKFYWRTKEDNLRKASLEHNSFNSALPYRSVVGKHPFLEGKVPSFSP